MTTIHQVAKSIHSAPQSDVDEPLGWRYEIMRNATGREEWRRVPLTPEEARHPKEGYLMPERTEHDFISSDLCEMFRGHFELRTDVAVFRNLVFVWDHPDVGDYAPNVAVVPNVRNRDANRSEFVVAEEGTRPLLVIEIVSRNSRVTDRIDKVLNYALVSIKEYVYIDKLTRRKQTTWELAGYRLNNGNTVPMLPDEDGALYLETVNMRIGIEEGRVWLEDGETGKDILTNLKARQALRGEETARHAAEARIAEEEEARQIAEARAVQEKEARQTAERRVAELEAELQTLRSKPNTVP